MDELGLELKNQREALGLSLEDVYQRIRINPDLLEAMESGSFQILPEAYARLFVRKYAQELGLDPTEIVQRFERGVGSPKSVAGPASRQSPPDRQMASERQRSAGGPSMGSVIAAVFGVAAVMSAVWFLMSDVEEQERAPLVLTERSRPADRRRPVDTQRPADTRRSADDASGRLASRGLPAPAGAPEAPAESASADTADITAPDSEGTGDPEVDTESETEGAPTAGDAEPADPGDAEAARPEAAEVPQSDEALDEETQPAVEEAAGTAAPVRQEVVIQTTPAVEDAAPEPTEAPSPVPTTEAAPSPEVAQDADAPQAGTGEEPIERPALIRERVVSAYSLSPAIPLQRRDTVLVLTAQAIQAARVAVSADGQRVFDEVLERESEHRWTARSRFYLEIAEASAVTLALQGHPVDPQCQPGRKLRLFVSRSSIWVEEVESTTSSTAETGP
ncbi:MAG: DUF4115 domain-containing protein [Candidatus Latescibacteria bacterium]|nr:DUF4115 domain-containing protein [Candidatus Latescibacterota bacterium]